MRLDAIAVGANPPYEVNVVVEVSVGSEPIKYEMNKEAGTMVVDRFLYTSMHYPGNYGFVPHTLSDDGDPIDVIIVSERKIVPGAVIAVRPIGVLRMVDEAGGDEKIIAVPASSISSRYKNIVNVSDLPPTIADKVEHFFAHYKDLEDGKWAKTQGWGDHEEAERLIAEAIERAKA